MKGFHLDLIFQKINHKHTVKHIVKDLKQSGLKDPEVFRLANKHNMLLVTYNYKDFRDMAKTTKTTGIIGISANLSTEQIDKKLLSLLQKNLPSDLYGKFCYINTEV